MPGVSGVVSATGSVQVAQLSPAVSAQHLPEGFGGGLFLLSTLGIDLSKPVVLSLPNNGNLAPGMTVQLLKLNPTTGGHDVAGEMTVSPDGKTLVSRGPILLASRRWPPPLRDRRPAPRRR